MLSRTLQQPQWLDMTSHRATMPTTFQNGITVDQGFFWRLFYFCIYRGFKKSWKITCAKYLNVMEMWYICIRKLRQYQDMKTSISELKRPQKRSTVINNLIRLTATETHIHSVRTWHYLWTRDQHTIYLLLHTTKANSSLRKYPTGPAILE